jgi:hypothetical protein
VSEFAPIRHKCFYWREQLHYDDQYDMRVKKGQRRVVCTCFVEGDTWTYTEDDVPSDCPQKMHCRYYIHFG